MAAAHAAGLRWFHTDANTERSFTQGATAVTPLFFPFYLREFAVKALGDGHTKPIYASLFTLQPLITDPPNRLESLEEFLP